MKSTIVNLIAVTWLVITGNANAEDMPEPAKKLCGGCHAIDNDVIATFNDNDVDVPAWNQVAAKYMGDTTAEDRLVYLVRFGSWDSTSKRVHPMFAGRYDSVSPETIKALVHFVLSLTPPADTAASTPLPSPPANIPAIDPSTVCIAEVKSKKELQILNGKIELGGSADYSLEMLANTNRPTKKEKEALSLWVSEHNKCKQMGDGWRNQNYPSAIIAILDKLYSEINFLAADLYARKISYGDFAKGQIRLYREFNANMIEAFQRIRQQLEAENQRREALKKEQAHQQQEALTKLQQVQRQEAEDQQKDELVKRQQALQLMQMQQIRQQQKLQSMPPCIPGLKGMLMANGGCYEKPTYNTDCTRGYMGDLHCTTR